MNKSELIDKVSGLAGLTKADTDQVLSALVNVVVGAVRKGDKVVLNGLGSFEATKRAAKVGINPATKAQIMISAKTAPRFKAAKSFKDALNA